jgi:hypothetical protein
MKEYLTILLSSGIFVLIIYIVAIPLSYLFNSWFDSFSIIPTKSWVTMFPIVSVILSLVVLKDYKKNKK